MDTNPGTTSSSQTPTHKQWSDDTCRDISNLDCFPEHVLDSDCQKKVIERFLNFYLGGKVPKGLSVTDLVFSVISIMPPHIATEEILWRKQEYNRKGSLFSLPLEDVQQAEEKSKSSFSLSKDKSVFYIKEKNTSDNEATDFFSQNVKSHTEADFPANKTHEKSEHYATELSGKPNDENESFEKEKLVTFRQNSHENTWKSYDHTTETNNIDFKMPGTSKYGKHQEIETEHVEISIDDTNQCCDEQEEKGNSKTKDNEIGKLKILPRRRWPGLAIYPRIPPSPPEFGPKENAAFISSCDRLLKNWDVDEKARTVLKFFFGAVALITIRSVTKSYKHVTNTFKSIGFQFKYSEYINHYSGCDLQYSIPNKRFIEVCHRKFRKRERSTIIMLAKIIIHSLIIEDQLPSERIERFYEISFPAFDDNPFKINFLNSTVLAHTANFKMELVSMVQGIANRLNLDSANLTIAETYCEDTAESWRRLLEYINNYLTPDSKTRTHHWAPLLDEEYFRDLSCDENYPLAVILAVFNEEITLNSDIWLSKWINKDTKDLEKFKEIGRKMFEEFLIKDEYARGVTKGRGRLGPNDKRFMKGK